MHSIVEVTEGVPGGEFYLFTLSRKDQPSLRRPTKKSRLDPRCCIGNTRTDRPGKKKGKGLGPQARTLKILAALPADRKEKRKRHLRAG